MEARLQGVKWRQTVWSDTCLEAQINISDCFIFSLTNYYICLSLYRVATNIIWVCFKVVVDRALWRLARQARAEVSRETIDGAVLNLLFWQRFILYLRVTIQDETDVFP
jgi:hypothetical protein